MTRTAPATQIARQQVADALACGALSMPKEGLVLVPCGYCGGTGYRPEYRHVENGKCFHCEGRRVHGELVPVERLERRYADRIRRERRAAKKAEEREAEQAKQEAEMERLAAEYKAQNADLFPALDELAEKGNEFAISLVERVNEGRELSERQLEAARTMLQKRADEAANASEVIEGRIVIEGEIVSTRLETNMYGTTRKALVKDERGFKVWGNLPSSIFEAQRGERVRFTATVEASYDDPSFGFFKRPAKAEVLETALAA